MKDFGYIIKNDEGKYWIVDLEMWSPLLCHATGYYDKECVLEIIHDYKLKNCHVVKVFIEEVEE